jgi:TonB family protein
MTERFSRAIWVSMMGHGIVAMLIFLRAVLAPQESITIRSAIRVDVVDLPDKITTPPTTPPAQKPPEPVKEAAKPEPVSKPEPKPKAPTVPDTRAKKADLAKNEKQALAKLKALAAIEKMKHEMNSQKSAAKASPVVKGNQVAAGNSLTGLDRLDYDRYFDELKGKILENWNLPQWLADADLSASVRVLIDERGYVIKKTIKRSSGNDVFDANALEAIDASSPLPAPPQRLRGVLSTTGIIFDFPQ